MLITFRVLMIFLSQHPVDGNLYYFVISTSFIILNFIGRCGENIIWYHFFYILIIILNSQFLYIFCLF